MVFNKKIKHIIIQAGGKGTRLKNLTLNKPKAIVTVNNLPIIFHLFKLFPYSTFYIIGDYKIDVLEKYLKTFCEVKYILINSNNSTGTLSGLNKALKFIPKMEKFLIIWSDLIVSNNLLEFNFHKSFNYIGLTNNFECRWKFDNNKFIEEKSSKNGVAGFFVFSSKESLSALPNSGEFVKWLSFSDIHFETIDLIDTNEYGDYSKILNNTTYVSRPFNKIQINDNLITKIPIDSQGKNLSKIEINWYKKVKKLNFNNLPKVLKFYPLTMEKVAGVKPHNLPSLNHHNKNILIRNIVSSLSSLHNLKTISSNNIDFIDTYITKTFARLDRVINLIPFANEKNIVINGKSNLNPFLYKKQLYSYFVNLSPSNFHPIHGDCTFSNILVKEDLIPVFIDPRGYFGKTLFYGDKNYDWAKFYYSLFSNYDQFNEKKFTLHISDKEVDFFIESNNFEDQEDFFLELVSNDINRNHLLLYTSLIWLSLTTYAWSDYDMICTSFYKGVELFNSFLKDNGGIFHV
jgi:GTP:adenosylcobinamide-phosphate guanylyltransferase